MRQKDRRLTSWNCNARDNTPNKYVPAAIFCNMYDSHLCLAGITLLY